MNTILESWKKGYEHGGYRTGQSFLQFIAISALFAAALAAGIAIAAGVSHDNVLDKYDTFLNDHSFQLVTTGTEIALAGILTGRAIFGGSRKINDEVRFQTSAIDYAYDNASTYGDE